MNLIFKKNQLGIENIVLCFLKTINVEKIGNAG